MMNIISIAYNDKLRIFLPTNIAMTLKIDPSIVAKGPSLWVVFCEIGISATNKYKHYESNE